MTCEEMEGSFPVGADDSDFDSETGLLTFRWAEDQRATVQVLADPSCTSDSDAWSYVIRHNLEPELLHRAGLLCDYYRELQSLGSAAPNAATVLRHLAVAEELCR